MISEKIYNNYYVKLIDISWAVQMAIEYVDPSELS